MSTRYYNLNISLIYCQMSLWDDPLDKGGLFEKEHVILQTLVLLWIEIFLRIERTGTLSQLDEIDHWKQSLAHLFFSNEWNFNEKNKQLRKHSTLKIGIEDWIMVKRWHNSISLQSSVDHELLTKHWISHQVEQQLTNNDHG